jgi:hypothetical protein
MSIENTLERIATALEALVEQGKGENVVVSAQLDPISAEVITPEMGQVTPVPAASKKKRSKKKGKKKTAAKKPEPTAAPTATQVQEAGEVVTNAAIPPFEPVPGAAPAPAEVIPAAEPSGMDVQTLTAEIGAIARQLGPRAAEIGTWLNNQYQVERISDLSPAYYQQFLQECRGMLPPPQA